MAWKLENATFVDGDDGLAYSVSLYERLEASNGEVFMARKGPLTEAQAHALGFDLSDVLADLDTLALASLDAARDDAAAKAARIADLEGGLKSTKEDRDSLAGRLDEALAQAAALDAERSRLATAVSEQADAIGARDAQIAALTARVAEMEAADPQPRAEAVGAEG